MKLTLQQMACSLDLPETTVERWIRQGRIPVRKSGHFCMFRKSLLEKWATAHHLSFVLPEKTSETRLGEVESSLLTAVERGGVYHDVAGETVEGVLRSSLERIDFLPEDTRLELLERLVDRERLTSTGIGKGVAIPHPRKPMSDDKAESTIYTCFLEKPIDYGAIDDQPVFVLFILASPTVKEHLHLLSRLSYCLRDESFIRFLHTCPPEEPFLAKIADFEKKLTAGTDQ